MKKPKNCPKCKSNKISEIIYGYTPAPEPTQEGKEDNEYYGGCIVSDNSPKWYCNNCKKKWGKLEN